MSNLIEGHAAISMGDLIKQVRKGIANPALKGAFGYIVERQDEILGMAMERESANEREIESLQKRIAELDHELDKTIAKDAIFVAKLQAKVEDLQAQVAALNNALNMIHNAALPDPHDERDISLTWLVSVIQKQYKEASATLKQEDKT